MADMQYSRLHVDAGIGQAEGELAINHPVSLCRKNGDSDHWYCKRFFIIVLFNLSGLRFFDGGTIPSAAAY